MRRILVILAFLFIGCNANSEPSINVKFNYLLLDRDNDVSAFGSCGVVGVRYVKVMIGDDIDNDRMLENNEILSQDVADCNQYDEDGDGSINHIDEVGLFSGTLAEGTYDLFAVEFLSEDMNPLPWQPFSPFSNETRISFNARNIIISSDVVFVSFPGDENQTPVKELQAYF